MDRKKVSLVIMAAGLGSRYGGSKQVDGIGPGGEILMEYSIHDAIRAGFDRVVFIIKPEMEALLRGMVGYLENRRTLAGENVEVRYVFQDFSSVPTFYHIPEGRTKPFGTVHALLCAAEAVDGPFCVINADDYYGIDAYRTIYEELVKLPEDGKLRSIRETLKIQLYEDGSLKDLTTDQPLSPETVVSMNFWGFSETIFPRLQAYFEDFLRTRAGDDLKAECLLPVMVGEELQRGTLEVSVLHSADRWFGMTYHEDRARVAEELRKLHAAGAYPATLRD